MPLILLVLWYNEFKVYTHTYLQILVIQYYKVLSMTLILNKQHTIRITLENYHISTRVKRLIRLFRTQVITSLQPLLRLYQEITYYSVATIII